MSALEVSLIAAAVLIGLTGAWSPCSFSMIETIGPRGNSGDRRTAAISTASFVPGAVLGGVITFGSLALLGSLLGGGQAAVIAALSLALAAAFAEAAGMPIAPQIRRQLPERWRFLLPMPLASLLYGVLLGLGFTTFVLSFGVWALAGISLALGEPQLGIAVGVAFGIGRSIPVIALAPWSDRPRARAVIAAMAERPALLRVARLGDAALLGVVAIAIAGSLLATGAPAARQRAALHPLINRAADPDAAGRDVVVDRPGANGLLLRGNSRIVLPGTDPAIGGPYIAVLAGDGIDLLDRTDATTVLDSIPAADANAIAVSKSWLVYRRHVSGGDRIVAVRTSGANPHRIAASHAPATLGRPDLARGLLVFSAANRHGSRIELRNLSNRHRRILARGHSTLVDNPSILRHRVAYVRITNKHQQIRIKRLRASGRGRLVLTLPANSVRDAGVQRGHHPHTHRFYTQRSKRLLWTTALTSHRVLVTALGFAQGRAKTRVMRAAR